MVLFLVFLFAYTLSQFFRSFLAVIAPGLAAELNLSAADLANMSAAFFLVFGLMQFPLGVALDRLGPRRTVPVIMMAAVAGAVMLANATTALGCIVANTLIGIGCSPIYMGALYYLGRTVPPERFGFVSACLLGFGSSGNLLAATPLSLATQSLGWRATFVGIAGATLVSAVLFFVMVRDPPQAVRPKGKANVLTELWQIVTLPRFWALMPLLLLGYASIVVERGLWLGPYFADVHSLDAVALGNAALAMAAAMSVGALFFGWLDHAVPGYRRLLVVIGTTFAAAGFVVLSVWPRPAVGTAITLMALIGFMGLCQPLLFAHARLHFPDHLLGRGMTFANFLTIGGAGLVQWVTGGLVSRLQASGMAAPDVYATLHLSFAVAIVAAMLVYQLSITPMRPAKPEARST